MISQSEVRALFQEHALDGPVPAGLTLKKVVADTPHGAVKLRAFPDKATAAERLKYLDLCREAGILAPAVIGQDGRYLVFDFARMEKASSDSKSLREIGRFLGVLNSIPTMPVHQDVFLSEVETWLDHISRVNLLSKKLSSFILLELRRCLPDKIPTGIDYWDAMPHNFGWQGDDFFLLDEKHTRHSFCCVGLVKPMLVLPGEAWAEVRAGYAEAGDLNIFDRNKTFLTYYYLLAALYFYSLITAAGRIKPGENNRLLRYRHLLLHSTNGLSGMQRLFADLEFLSRHPGSLPRFIRMHFQAKLKSNRAD